MHVRRTIVLLFLLSACRAPLGPTGKLDGTWTGAIVDSAAGTGTTSWTMAQRGQGLTGTWSATFSVGGVMTGGSLGGATEGAQVSIFLTPETPLVCSPSTTLSGTLGVTATLSGNRLQGTYVVLTCTGATNGTIDLRK